MRNYIPYHKQKEKRMMLLHLGTVLKYLEKECAFLLPSLIPPLREFIHYGDVWRYLGYEWKEYKQEIEHLGKVADASTQWNNTSTPVAKGWFKVANPSTPSAKRRRMSANLSTPVFNICTMVANLLKNYRNSKVNSLAIIELYADNSPPGL